MFVGASSSGDGPGDRSKNDGRLRVLLRRRTGKDAGGLLFPEFVGDDDSMSVCERCTRPGRARGPPGTDGALVICTGRGLGIDVRLCLVVRVNFSVGFLVSFLVLEFCPRVAFRPREGRKPAVTLAPIAGLVLRELTADGAPASSTGYGKAGGGTFGDGTASMSDGGVWTKRGFEPEKLQYRENTIGMKPARKERKKRESHS